MFEVEDLRSNYIPNEIRKKVLTEMHGIDCVGYYSQRFFEYVDKDINHNWVCIVICAMNHKDRGLIMKQVAYRHPFDILDSANNDIYLSSMQGYRCIFGIYKRHSSYYNYETMYSQNEWSVCSDKECLYPPCKFINYEFFEGTEFQYMPKYLRKNVVESMRVYKQFPKCELIAKSKLKEFKGNKTILKMCSKDKEFLNFLKRNEDTVTKFNTQSIVYAFKHNCGLEDATDFIYAKSKFMDRFSLSKWNDEERKIKKIISKNYSKLKDYEPASEHSRSYIDYLKACLFLNVDLNQSKNLKPNDFQVWHDIRINQMKTKMAEQTADMLKELNGKMIATRNVYKNLEICESEDLKVFIAKNKMELIREGDALVHCVGRMDYDQRQAQGKSLICFIRKTNDINTPYVTLELALKDNVRVVQCYGKKDTQPCEDVRKFVYEEFEPFAKRVVAKVRAKEKKANKEAVAV